MRLAFARTLAELADRDRRIVLLTGDLGFNALDEFMARHPNRFVNVGVAEQNMIGVATGLAEAGLTPFVYSIVPFAVLRPYEFIRNGPVMHHLNVRIVGVGAGVEYGTNGHTHYGMEDLGVARLQPGLTVLAPGDAEQTRAILLATHDRAGPIYYRLGKDDRVEVPGLGGRFEWDRVTFIRSGRDVLLLTTSSIAAESVAVADALSRGGVEPTLGVVAQIHPPPRRHLMELLATHRVVAAIENHYADGGLGTVVAEIIAEEGLACRLVRCGFRSKLDGRSGPTAHLHVAYGVGPHEVERRIRAALVAAS